VRAYSVMCRRVKILSLPCIPFNLEV